MESIINIQGIYETLEKAKQASKEQVRKILAKAKEAKGLSQYEVAVLLQFNDAEIDQELIEIAKKIKEDIYGKRVVIFAPLYLTNECCNNCLYCGFRAPNKTLERKTLDFSQIIEEAKALEDQGHKRILLVGGEHPQKSNISYITSAIKEIYANVDIRRLNVNIAPLSVEEFRMLKEAGIGTYQLFQETYDPEVYKKMHISGKKADYNWRVTAFDRAMEAGIDDVGMGILFGLADWRFEIIALLQHAEHLEAKFGVGPHTLSVPRLRPAPGAALQETPYPISDDEFKKIVAILRLAVPYTGIILSTRETPELRDELLNIGVSQISAGSSTSPGGYKKEETKEEVQVEREANQFAVEDNRSMDEVIKSICHAGYLPSFCTACYRQGRTGESFMELAKTGDIKNMCQANALLSFEEHLNDFASSETKEIGKKVIEEHLKQIPNEKIAKAVEEKLKKVDAGDKDQYI